LVIKTYIPKYSLLVHTITVTVIVVVTGSLDTERAERIERKARRKRETMSYRKRQK
jgi:hypothetical protein